MKPDKNSMDYQLNLLALEEMENLVFNCQSKFL